MAKTLRCSVLVGSGDGSIRHWNADTGTLITHFQGAHGGGAITALLPYRPAPTAVEDSDLGRDQPRPPMRLDGRVDRLMLLSGGSDGSIMLWQVRRGDWFLFRIFFDLKGVVGDRLRSGF